MTQPGAPDLDASLAPVVTLVEGSTFCLSGRSGDLAQPSPMGLFFQDTRILSTWRLRVDGAAPHVVAVASGEPYAAQFLSRVAPAGSASTVLLIERHRYVGDGMREDIRIRNLANRPEQAQLSLEVGADFADLFEVKEDRIRHRVSTVAQCAGNSLTVRAVNLGGRGVRVEARGAQATRRGLELAVDVPARGEWSTTVVVHALQAGQVVPARFPAGRPIAESQPAQRMRAWRAGSSRVETPDRRLQSTLRRSVNDLGSLRIFDPAHPDSVAVAAGAPWFMALFGRDSLLSSYMAMPMELGLAQGTLQALARTQGQRIDPATEEQPGRILHETRLGAQFPLSRGGGSTYYGTADATPLFVVVLAELARWGAPRAEIDALVPHADRALDWVEQYGDRDGDGFVEYSRMTDSGLRNQGWKDSADGITFADGRIADPPIALCEVQGYVYAAYLARAYLATLGADEAAAAHWSQRAAVLKRAFNDAFWLPDAGWYALGLDRDKRPIDALASNMGHCLWSGLVDEDKAPAVADRLLSPDMFTGWGVRTLASSMGAYNPMSYHNGSVWPHDNALIATGLMRYGLVGHAQRVATGILDAAAVFDGRLPELFCGFDRSDYAAPLPYPTSCSPQAWAAAAPIQLLRTLLGLDPDIPRQRVALAPAVPAQYSPITVHDLHLDGARATLTSGAETALSGLPAGVRVVRPQEET